MVSDIGSKAHFIEGLASGTSSNLHNGSQERHRVEKTREPKHNRSSKLFGPGLKLSASQNQVFKPNEQTLLGEIGNSLPARGNGVHVKRVSELLHGFSNVKGSLETSIKVR
jgi:hypothetical protein